MERLEMNIVKVSCVGLAAAFVVSAYAATPAPAIREDLIQKTATVEAVDQVNRTVTLRGEDGKSTTVEVGDEVKNLPQVKVGDKVTVSYYQALAAEVKKPGEGVKGVESSTSSVTAPLGSKPAAGAGVLLRTTVVIDSVDTKLNTVTFTRSDGAIADRRGRAARGPGVHQGPQEGRSRGDRLRRGARHRSEAGEVSRFTQEPRLIRVSRRLVVLAAVLAVLVAAYAAAGFWLAPKLIRSQAQAFVSEKVRPHGRDRRDPLQPVHVRARDRPLQLSGCGRRAARELRVAARQPGTLEPLAPRRELQGNFDREAVHARAHPRERRAQPGRRR